MPPPDFHLDHTLSDWPGYTLELRCPCSPRVAFMPVRLLAERGNRPFRTVLEALRCSTCRGKPAPVHLAELQAMMPPGLTFDPAVGVGSPPGCLGWWRGRPAPTRNA